MTLPPSNCLIWRFFVFFWFFFCSQISSFVEARGSVPPRQGDLISNVSARPSFPRPPVSCAPANAGHALSHTESLPHSSPLQSIISSIGLPASRAYDRMRSVVTGLSVRVRFVTSVCALVCVRKDLIPVHCRVPPHSLHAPHFFIH